MKLKRLFEDVAIGEKQTSVKQKVTKEDIQNFANLTGDHYELHTNEAFAKETPFGQIIAHGLFILSLQQGLLYESEVEEIHVLAFLEVENWKFKKAVVVNDEIFSETEVIEKIETSKADRGIIKRKHTVFNQRNEIVQEGLEVLLVKRRD